MPELHIQIGDVVYAGVDIFNDGGVPDCAPDALLASVGARGVLVQIGFVEADERLVIYLVRFEDENGTLGPPVGCLPEELLQEEATT